MSNRRNNNGYSSQNDAVPWIVTIICLVACPPLGIVMLLSKIKFNLSGTNFDPSQYARTYRDKAQQAKQKWQQYTQPDWRQQSNASQQHNTTQQRTTYQQYDNAGHKYSPGQTDRHEQTSSNAQQYSGTYHAPQPQQAKDRTAGKPKSQKKDKEKRDMPGKGTAILMTLSAILLSLIGIVTLSSGLGTIATEGMTGGALGLSIFGGFSLLGGVISTFVRGFTVRRMRKFAKYAAIIGTRRVMAVSDISKAAGETATKTRSNLQMMVDAGVFGSAAFIDSELDSLVLSYEDAEKIRAEQPQSKQGDSSSASETNPYVAIINELHMLGAETSDPVICDKIQRIEDVTVKIFRLVEEKPEKVPQIRRFMNYYLPTTLKLLHSYETLEKQGVDGENITAAKNDIERVLDTLVSGYEQQLDNLFMSDKIDISADIDVLENLMKQDGLTNEGNILRTSDGGILKTSGGS